MCKSVVCRFVCAALECLVTSIEGQKRALGPLEHELQTVVNFHMSDGSPLEEPSALNCWVIYFSGPTNTFLENTPFVCHFLPQFFYFQPITFYSPWTLGLLFFLL